MITHRIVVNFDYMVTKIEIRVPKRQPCNVDLAKEEPVFPAFKTRDRFPCSSEEMVPAGDGDICISKRLSPWF